MISAAQIRAARSLLNVSQDRIIEETGLSKSHLSDIENGKAEGKSSTLEKLELFYTSNGLEFMEHDGVRRSPSGQRILKGQKGFRQFYDEIYETARRGKIDITLFNGSSQLLRDALGSEFLAMHVARMTAIKENFRFRVILEEGDDAVLGNSYCEYKWFPREQFEDQSIFTFGNKCAIVDPEDEISITIFDQIKLTKTLRVGFDLAWEHMAKASSV